MFFGQDNINTPKSSNINIIFYFQVGGFLCVPGSTPFLEEWTSHKQAPHLKPISIRVPEDDKMLEFKQQVPLRKGQMVVWDSGQAHANVTSPPPPLFPFSFFQPFLLA